MSKPDYQLSPEQLVLSEERKRKKETTLPNGDLVQVDKSTKFLKREWIQLRPRSESAVKIMTWNLLARSLVQRKLFPESDCLRAGVREPLLFAELLHYSPDIVCLQEVDHLEKLTKSLTSDFSYSYAAGRGKKHGCAIFHNNQVFEQVAETVIRYDELDVRANPNDDKPATYLRGSSSKTNNVALVVALRRHDDPSRGCIVATTHAFWHPSYSYERCRQMALLSRGVVQFQRSQQLTDWPCFIAGDFNFSPTEPGYALVVGEPLTIEQEAILDRSRIVHMSIDPAVPKTSSKLLDDEGSDSISNIRQSVPEDGLLDSEELVSLFTADHPPLRSAYDSALALVPSEADNTMSARSPELVGRRGQFEPMWTSYTLYWKTVLDYIFILDPPSGPIEISGVLPTHRTNEIAAGLPRLHVCGSDHVSLMVEVVL